MSLTKIAEICRELNLVLDAQEVPMEGRFVVCNFLWGVGSYVKSGILSQMKLKQMPPRRQKKAMKYIKENGWEQDVDMWVWRRSDVYPKT